MSSGLQISMEVTECITVMVKILHHSASQRLAVCVDGCMDKYTLFDTSRSKPCSCPMNKVKDLEFLSSISFRPWLGYRRLLQCRLLLQMSAVGCCVDSRIGDVVKDDNTELHLVEQYFAITILRKHWYAIRPRLYQDFRAKIDATRL
jgi:hypothetical protein